jgi:23S rRNA pseudouridine1911/1915/1917 synthase
MDWRIVFEDRDVLVVEKPAGLLTSTVPRERRPTLLAAVREYVLAKHPKARLGLIHRLDRDAAGLLVFSKSNLAYQSLKTQFFKHTVTRSYIALVEGKPNPDRGTIRSRLEERADGTVYSTRDPRKGQLAITDFETIKTTGPTRPGSVVRSILRVSLHTGRKHQVRVHLAERGMPIVGDPMYGKPDRAGLHLIAAELAFDDPRTGKRRIFNLPPPKWGG